MQGIQKVTIEAVSVKDSGESEHGTYWKYGIKVQGEWHNGILGSQNQVDGMKAKKGKEVELFFYVDEKYGNKVRFVTDKDRKEAPKKVTQHAPDNKYRSPEVAIEEAIERIEALEKRMNVYDKNTKGFKTPITDQVNQDAQAPIDHTDDEGQPDDLETKNDLPF